MVKTPMSNPSDYNGSINVCSTQAVNENPFMQLWTNNIQQQEAAMTAQIVPHMLKNEPVQPRNAKVSRTMTAGDERAFTDADWSKINAVAAVLAESDDPKGTPCARASHLAKVEFWPTRHALNYLVAAGRAHRSGSGSFLRWHEGATKA